MENRKLSRDAEVKLALDNYKNKFDTDSEAKRYSLRHANSGKHKRELKCIKRALSDIKKNSLLLDLPCGAGRLSYVLNDLGYRVVGADYSTHMIHYAQMPLVSGQKVAKNISFEQQDVVNIKHPSNTFDVVVCNRLFHHYPASESRRAALKELARVSQGPVIVSFFNSNSLSAWWSKIRNTLRNKKPVDRQPIPFQDFKKDIAACGLKIQKTYYTRFGISPQTYVKLVKA